MPMSKVRVEPITTLSPLSYIHLGSFSLHFKFDHRSFDCTSLIYNVFAMVVPNSKVVPIVKFGFGCIVQIALLALLY